MNVKIANAKHKQHFLLPSLLRAHTRWEVSGVYIQGNTGEIGSWLDDICTHVDRNGMYDSCSISLHYLRSLLSTLPFSVG